METRRVLLLKLPNLTGKKLSSPTVAVATSMEVTGGVVTQVKRQLAGSSRVNRTDALGDESMS